VKFQEENQTIAANQEVLIIIQNMGSIGSQITGVVLQSANGDWCQIFLQKLMICDWGMPIGRILEKI